MVPGFSAPPLPPVYCRFSYESVGTTDNSRDLIASRGKEMPVGERLLCAVSVTACTLGRE